MTVPDYLSDRVAGQSATEQDDDFTGVGELPTSSHVHGLSRRYRLPDPPDPAPGDRDLLVTLDEMDRSTWASGSPGPTTSCTSARGSRVCPATEPAETGPRDGPWPPVNTERRRESGIGVIRLVVDTGWYPPAAALPWRGWRSHRPARAATPSPTRRVTSGSTPATARSSPAWSGRWHPACTRARAEPPRRPSRPRGRCLESDLVSQLDAALDREPRPHLINLSAGCPTRLNLPARAFEDWWADVSTTSRTIVSWSPRPATTPALGQFWPASFDWAVGVGSLDRDGQVSDFSNWGDSVDVFALGRNLVNAFPRGALRLPRDVRTAGTSGSSTTCSRAGAEPRSRRRSSPG